MFIAKLKMSAVPEKRSEVFQTLASLAVTIRKEKGCRRCEFFQQSEDQSSFEIVEEWQTREELDEHLRSPVFAILLGLGPLLLGPPTMQIYNVASAEGMEAVRKARGTSTGSLA
jgi:quinol monooxygenase YgiN